MDVGTWEEVQSALVDALGQEPADRARFLASLTDDEIRREVESLLAADTEGLEQQLENAIAGIAGRLTGVNDPEPFPSTIARYRLFKLIGAGGMSEVYLAEDSKLGRMVALKLLPPAFAGDPDRIVRFEQEARAASALNHPNIVTIFDVGNADGRWFIAMEYIAGAPLSTMLRGTPLPLAEALAIAEQVATALAAAHQEGILHRDIKPANVMVRPDGLVKVVDFGLARLTPTAEDRESGAGMTLPGMIVGTPAYMAPEQACGGAVDHTVDLWSLGAVLYEMVTGTPAFAGPTTANILAAVLEKRPAPISRNVPNAPRALEELVAKLLSKDAATRFNSSLEVRERLQVIRAEMSGQGNRPGARMIAATCVAAFVIAGISYYSGSKARVETPALEQVTTTLAENRVTAAAYSADGRAVAWSEWNGALMVRRLESAESQSQELPLDWKVETISWHSSGKKLMLSGYVLQPLEYSVRVLDLSSKKLTMLKADARSAAYSPDGRSVAFTNDARTQVWIADAEGGNTRKVLAGSTTDTFPTLFWGSSSRLSYQRRRLSPTPGRLLDAETAYEYRYGSIAAGSAELLTEATTAPMLGVCSLDNGRVLYIARRTNLDLTDRNIWSVQTDVRTGQIIDSPQQLTAWDDTNATALSCVRDGTMIGTTLQVNRPGVYVAQVDRAGPILKGIRRLTLDESPTAPHAWTADSKAVLFERRAATPVSGKTHWDVFRQGVNERVSRPLSTTGDTEYYPVLSSNPGFVLFQQYDPNQGRKLQRLMRVPVDGGPAEPVPWVASFDEFRCALGRKRCIVRTTENNNQQVYYELDPFKGRGRELLRTPFMSEVMGDWDLSSDGSLIAIPNHSPSTAKIHLLRLDPKESEAAEWEIHVPGVASIYNLHWDLHDAGWYASVRVPNGVILTYIYRNGKHVNLHQEPQATWGLPAPDGKQIAFLGQQVETNFWRLKDIIDSPHR